MLLLPSQTSRKCTPAYTFRAPVAFTRASDAPCCRVKTTGRVTPAAMVNLCTSTHVRRGTGWRGATRAMMAGEALWNTCSTVSPLGPEVLVT